MFEPAADRDARADTQVSGEADGSTPAPPPSPPTRETTRRGRQWRIIASTAAVIMICGIAYWRIRIIRGLFNSLLPYAPVIFPSLIALGTIIFKDWKNYKPHWVRWVLIAFVIAAGGIGVAYQHLQREEKAEAARLSQQNVDGLKGQVKAAQDSQTENTKIFAKQFSELSKELGDLKTKVTTKELQDKIANLQSRLDKTLDPPRAKLLFSFAPIKVVRIDDSRTTGEPITEKNIPVAADGSFHVDFTVINLTDVDAIDGEMTLQICDICKFAKEPPEFTRLAGEDERQRNKTFERIHSKVQFYTLSADVIAPPGSRDVALGMYFRCSTCIRDADAQRIMVHLVGRQ
jgi:hypothetical protein